MIKVTLQTPVDTSLQVSKENYKYVKCPNNTMEKSGTSIWIITCCIHYTGVNMVEKWEDEHGIFGFWTWEGEWQMGFFVKHCGSVKLVTILSVGNEVLWIMKWLVFIYCIIVKNNCWIWYEGSSNLCWFHYLWCWYVFLYNWKMTVSSIELA